MYFYLENYNHCQIYMARYGLSQRLPGDRNPGFRINLSSMIGLKCPDCACTLHCHGNPQEQPTMGILRRPWNAWFTRFATSCGKSNTSKSNVLKQILVTWMISKSVDSLQHGIAAHGSWNIGCVSTRWLIPGGFVKNPKRVEHPQAIALSTQLRRIGGQTSGGMVKTRWSQWWQLVAVSCPL